MMRIYFLHYSGCFHSWYCRWLAGVTALLVAFGVAAGGVAEVLHVSGDCRWTAPDALAEQPLAKGQWLPVGARIVAGADGHAYLGTVDQGFLSVRPRSSLRIERYDSAPGQAVDIRLVLEQGRARVVSGAAARQMPQGFRMETPLAVIGVRGTDFSAAMEGDVTRVAVRAGGVVVSPLSDSCRPGMAGPCGGNAAMELFAREAGVMVEVQRGQALPVKRELSGANGPEAKRTPRQEAAPEERRLLADEGVAPLDVKREALVAQTLSGTPAAPPPPTVLWGRWGGLAGGPAADLAQVQALMRQREIVALNPWFVLVREPGVPVLPAQGQVTLGLSNAEALIQSASGSVVAAARIDQGRLLLDFGHGRFETNFVTQGGGHVAAFRGAGPIHADGTFSSFWQNGTTGSLVGAIEPGATGAGMLFNQPLSPDAVATGAIRWGR